MSAPQPFHCKEAASLLVFYACGETTEQETALVETHLAACPLCAAQLAEERGLHESLMEALQASEQNDTGGILLSQCRSELAEALDDLVRAAIARALAATWLAAALDGVASGLKRRPSRFVWRGARHAALAVDFRATQYQFHRPNCECFARCAIHG